ncbi:hypothetical protein C8R46DRAFT_1053001 [Mycena filopes]|nr:hypothetical protein C8R46DRAFT_1053001 [Mycena filopes]
MAAMLPELIEYTLDFLHDIDDRATLLSCSLVSQGWVHSSQSHLFSNIHLRFTPFWQLKYPGVTGILSHRLNSVLNESPHLARYIRALKIENDRFGPSCWVNSEPSLPQLLSKLSGLRSLVLSTMYWEGLLEDRRQSLRALLRSSTLNSVRLIRCSTFLQFAGLVSSASSLKRLSVYGFGSNGFDLPPNPDDQLLSPVTLEFLALENVDPLEKNDILFKLSPLLDITRLYTLRCLDYRSYASAAPLLALLGQTGTLRHLELGDIEPIGDTGNPFSLVPDSSIPQISICD